MKKNIKVLYQYLLPQHALSRLAGWIAESRVNWFKNLLIQLFIKKFQVNLSDALIEDVNAYPDFNSFFTRYLKPELRPIAQGPHELTSPVDGIISQFGKIDKDSLFQAKGFYFNLADLLGSAEDAKLFQDGEFITFYLSPKDYHRVHMPLTGRLYKTRFIPGKLFSVSPLTAKNIPGLFSKNERLICLFETEKNFMAIILIGAMLVGSINTVWGNAEKISVELPKGNEMGHFKMGSSVIVLFGRNHLTWSNDLKQDMSVKMGQLLGSIGKTD